MEPRWAKVTVTQMRRDPAMELSVLIVPMCGHYAAECHSDNNDDNEDKE